MLKSCVRILLIILLIFINLQMCKFYIEDEPLFTVKVVKNKRDTQEIIELPGSVEFIKLKNDPNIEPMPQGGPK